MTVYVDDMYKYPIGKYRRMKMSHMIADTEQELHDMADKIGVARKWYQGDHYDICMSMREKAIKLGATQIKWRETPAILGWIKAGRPNMIITGPVFKPRV